MFQTRSFTGELREYPTIQKALQAAKENSDIWKISFAVGDERIRLVREGNNWVLRQMEDEVASILETNG